MSVTPDESFAVTWAGHSTALIELDGVRILTDPALRNRVGPLRRIVSPASPQLSERIDAVMLSHIHADHADIPSLRRLSDAATVFAPRGAARWLARRGVRNVHELSSGEHAYVGGVRITATAARHDGRRHPLGARAEAIGFTAHGSSGLYFAGDTDLFEGMCALRGTVELALLPIAGWGPTVGPGHLDPSRAVQAAARIAPRLVIPIHWGTLTIPWWPARHPRDPQRPAREFAALMARAQPEVEVRVLSPGERIELKRRGHGAECVPSGSR